MVASTPATRLRLDGSAAHSLAGPLVPQQNRESVRRSSAARATAPPLTPLSLIDALIPGLLGLVLVIWPRFVFLGSKVTPDAAKTTLIRRLGGLLLGIGLVFLLVALIDR